MTEFKDETRLSSETPRLKVSSQAGGSGEHGSPEASSLVSSLDTGPVTDGDDRSASEVSHAGRIEAAAGGGSGARPGAAAPVRTRYGAGAASKKSSSARGEASKFGRKQILTITAMTVGGFLACIISSVWSCFNEYAHPEPCDNVIAVGPDSKIKKAVELPLNPPEELDGLTKSAILDLRKKYAAQHADFLSGPYKPYNPLFKCIEDIRPWWGIKGFYWNGRGQRSMEGPSLEGQAIANPFLLVSPDWRDRVVFNRARIGDPDLVPDFPYQPKVEKVTFDPSQKKMEVTYDLSAFKKRLSEINGWTSMPEGLYSKLFLKDYNARDFGYNHKIVEVESPANMASPISLPARLLQFVHGGETCGIPCNNVGEFGGVNTQSIPIALPSRIRVKLWKDYPASYLKVNAEKGMPETPPDFNVYFNFK